MLRPAPVTATVKFGCMLETPPVSHATCDASENVLGDADNQQGSRSADDAGLTPQRLHAELLETGTTELEDEDIVHALWRHGDHREQGSRTGRCGWITSF
jgi:hypothetical protein